MTGLKVLEVNVHIQGVHPRSDKDDKNQNENDEEKDLNEDNDNE